jgi:hypothetical protein
VRNSLEVIPFSSYGKSEVWGVPTAFLFPGITPCIEKEEKPFFSKTFLFFLDNSKKEICQFFLPFDGEKILGVHSGRGPSLSPFLRTLLIGGSFPSDLFKNHCKAINMSKNENPR